PFATRPEEKPQSGWSAGCAHTKEHQLRALSASPTFHGAPDLQRRLKLSVLRWPCDGQVQAHNAHHHRLCHLWNRKAPGPYEAPALNASYGYCILTSGIAFFNTSSSK